jgi:hypothetical protein
MDGNSVCQCVSKLRIVKKWLKYIKNINVFCTDSQ